MQAQFASIRGEVKDESGGLIPGATVTLSGPRNKSAITNAAGEYAFVGLAGGNYSITAAAPSLALPKPVKVALKPSAVAIADLELRVAATQQQVSVQDNGAPAVSVDASSNAGALVLRGRDLDTLADNAEDLAADLQALAGPSAGPNGGSIFIDGFSGGQLPSKESIREIRINQNPFSPEYDKLGFGRIEIFTKPGSDKFRGNVYYNFGDGFWNSRNPYAARKAPFLLKEYGGSISGPIGKRSSYFLDIRRDSIDNGAIVNGSAVDAATLAIVSPYTDVFRVPQRRITVSPRVDYQIDANNVLVARYSFFSADVAESGVGSFNLPSRGVHASAASQTLQLTETAVLAGAVVNETRFQYFRNDAASVANTAGPAINVLGAFNGGGAPVGRASGLLNSYEFQNYTSIAKGAHTLRFGVRLRGEAIADSSPQNFNGTFVFSGGDGVTSIERYRRTLLYQRQGLTAERIRALGGGAAQFSMAAGEPAISGNELDFGGFAGDDWRLRPNITVSLGARYETQSNINDWRDIAPRIGVAWAPGGAGKARPKSVIRVGFGTFYDRFGLSNTLAARRYDGIVQQQFVIANPDFFPAVPSVAAALGTFRTQQTVQRISSTLRAPYLMQSALAFERQLPRNTTLAVTYAKTRGVRMLRSQALSGPVFLNESSGLYNQNQLLFNVNTKLTAAVSLFGAYVLNRAESDTDGLGTFPGKPGTFAGEYGRASTDVHNRVSFGGSIETKWKIRLNPLLTMLSGPPFDITAGRDLYGATLFNARPGFAANKDKPGVVVTSYGALDPNPAADDALVPRNYGRGPGSILLNLRIARSFAFGLGEGREAPSNIPGGGERRSENAGVFAPAAAQAGLAKVARRYNITVSMSIRNLLNHTNPGAIIGNITSPLFGQANQAAGAADVGGTGFSESANNRRLELQTRFTW